MAQVSIDSRCGRHICMSSEGESNKNAADSFYLQTLVAVEFQGARIPYEVPVEGIGFYGLKGC